MLLKKGDIVICTDAGIDNQYRVTKGKQYVIEMDHNSKVWIKNDRGVLGSYWIGRFDLVQQIREEKLKQLGIE